MRALYAFVKSEVIGGAATITTHTQEDAPT